VWAKISDLEFLSKNSERFNSRSSSFRRLSGSFRLCSRGASFPAGRVLQLIGTIAVAANRTFEAPPPSGCTDNGLGNHPMKSRQIESWLRPGGLVVRLFSAPSGDRAAPFQSIFHFDLAEIWRLGQQRRSQYLAALLNRKSNETALDVPDRFSGRTHPRVQRGASER
jgi:hypothetical protein